MMDEERLPGQGVDRDSARAINRTRLLLIFAIGVVPVVLAWILQYHFPQWLPDMTTNEGTLIQPPITIEGTRTYPAGKWTLLIPVSDRCDETCRQVFYLSRQVHVALGKDSDRLQRVVFATVPLSTGFAEFLASRHGDVLIENADENGVVEKLRTVAPGIPAETMVFLMDPHGNIMMVYSPGQGGKPMLKDLKHLLKVSGIG